MRASHTINYGKRWSDDGTCYRQTVTLSIAEYQQLGCPTCKQVEYEDGNLYIYTNLIGRDWIADKLGLWHEDRFHNDNTVFKVCLYV